MICRACKTKLIALEGEHPNEVAYICPNCGQPYFGTGKPVPRAKPTVVGEFLGIDVFDYGGDEQS